MHKVLMATPAFTNEDLLIECLKSYPDDINSMVIFDGYEPELYFPNIIDKIPGKINHVEIPYEHKGVCGSWNRITKYAFEENDYTVVILIGSDMKFTHDYIYDFIDKMNVDKDAGLITAKEYGFNFFAITKECYEKTGTFDENFFPAYHEDCDFHYRTSLVGVKHIDIGNPEKISTIGSATIKKNNQMNIANGTSFPINAEYYKNKWNDNTFMHPFNNDNLTIKDWELDINKYEIKKEIWKKAYYGDL